jgi:signal transduction histidine kinase
MINGACGPVTEESFNTLGRVRHHVQALTELITSMLDLSRVEAGRLPVHLQEVRVLTLFEELKDETREICDQSGLDVVWQGEQALVPLYTDIGKLKIILKNLLGNALKFTPQGRITVQAQRRDAGVEFCVIDTGVGIPRDALAVIFEPFQQVEDGDSQRGTGLGLHIVKRLVELLGGTVAVESEVGQGSTFRVWMPSGAPRLLTAGDRVESKETNTLKSL